MPKSLADVFASGTTKQTPRKQNLSELALMRDMLPAYPSGESISDVIPPEKSTLSQAKQDLNSFLATYGPGNPEPQQMKDSANTRTGRNPLHTTEEYIESKTE